MKKMVSVWKPKKDGSMKMKWKKKKIKPITYLSEDKTYTQS